MDLPSTCVSRFTHVSTSEFFIYNYPWKAKMTGSKQNFTRKNKIHQHAKRCPPNIWLSSVHNTMCCLLCATQSNPNQFHLKPTVSQLHTQEKIVYIHTTEEENLLPISILTVLNDVFHRLKRNCLRNNSSKLNNVGNSVYFRLQESFHLEKTQQHLITCEQLTPIMTSLPSSLSLSLSLYLLHTRKDSVHLERQIDMAVPI